MDKLQKNLLEIQEHLDQSAKRMSQRIKNINDAYDKLLKGVDETLAKCKEK